MSRDHLHALLESVCDEKSFLRFLAALAEDCQAAASQDEKSPGSPFGPNPGGWENSTIHAFLEAAVAWANDSAKGMPQTGHKPSANPWKRCAEILFAGKFYE